MALASYRSRFILRICAPTCPFSSPEVCHNRHRGRLGQATLGESCAGADRPGNPTSPQLPDSPAAFLESWRGI
jgi:hypothetical protein